MALVGDVADRAAVKAGVTSEVADVTPLPAPVFTHAACATPADNTVTATARDAMRVLWRLRMAMSDRRRGQLEVELVVSGMVRVLPWQSSLEVVPMLTENGSVFVTPFALASRVKDPDVRVTAGVAHPVAGPL